MYLETFLIGYSARVAMSAVELTDTQRRNLFKPDVRAALSVDDMIWPDAFTRSYGVQPPEWVGYVQDLWASLPDLNLCAARAGLRENVDFTVIAVKVHVDTSSHDRWRLRIRECEPAEVPAPAHSLGFDVADDFLMSALCNGAFLAHENTDALRAQWAPLLGPYHLFTESDAAYDFVPVAESRFPEHTPFYVFEVLSLSPEAGPPIFTTARSSKPRASP